MGNCPSNAEWIAERTAKREAAEAKVKADRDQKLAEQKAEMRRDGVQSPPPMMMHGGVIRLTSDAAGFFDWTPLAQHNEWLQDRLTREEWSALILSINNTAITNAIAWESQWSSGTAPSDPNWKCQRRTDGARSEAYRIRADWLERGLDLLMPHATPAKLYFKVVPVGSTPVNNAAGLGEMSAGAGAASAGATMDGATATGTVASPPAYPADNAPPGGLNAAVPAVASVYAFPIVVKPAPSHSAASTDSISGDPRPFASASWRFCPHCAVSLESQKTGKSFCLECGEKWWK